MTNMTQDPNPNDPQKPSFEEPFLPEFPPAEGAVIVTKPTSSVIQAEETVEPSTLPFDALSAPKTLALVSSQPNLEKPTLTAESLKDKKAYIEKAIQVLEEDESQELASLTGRPPRAPIEPPWTLQQFFNGEIDLDVELATRFASMPVMSTMKVRSLGTRTGRSVATLAAQDGSSQVIFDADKTTGVVQVSFTFGSMLTLRFLLKDLVDRKRWLELMRREEGGLAFLWGPGRWEQDYVICLARKYYTNFYSFSPNGFEAAARFTPDITKQVLAWLESCWGPLDDENQNVEPPKMLSW